MKKCLEDGCVQNQAITGHAGHVWGGGVFSGPKTQN